ncbi:hypothetical protein MUP32_04685, partial [Candidatus Microgenomates bacterium]|nr:hypothetical protein [Candidatus Microgenomates bacterium]
SEGTNIHGFLFTKPKSFLKYAPLHNFQEDLTTEANMALKKMILNSPQSIREKVDFLLKEPYLMQVLRSFPNQACMNLFTSWFAAMDLVEVITLGAEEYARDFTDFLPGGLGRVRQDIGNLFRTKRQRVRIDDGPKLTDYAAAGVGVLSALAPVVLPLPNTYNGGQNGSHQGQNPPPPPVTTDQQQRPFKLFLPVAINSEPVPLDALNFNSWGYSTIDQSEMKMTIVNADGTTNIIPDAYITNMNDTQLAVVGTDGIRIYRNVEENGRWILKEILKIPSTADFLVSTPKIFGRSMIYAFIFRGRLIKPSSGPEQIISLEDITKQPGQPLNAQEMKEMLAWEKQLAAISSLSLIDLNAALANMQKGQTGHTTVFGTMIDGRLVTLFAKPNKIVAATTNTTALLPTPDGWLFSDPLKGKELLLDSSFNIMRRIGWSTDEEGKYFAFALSENGETTVKILKLIDGKSWVDKDGFEVLTTEKLPSTSGNFRFTWVGDKLFASVLDGNGATYELIWRQGGSSSWESVCPDFKGQLVSPGSGDTALNIAGAGQELLLWVLENRDFSSTTIFSQNLSDCLPEELIKIDNATVIPKISSTATDILSPSAAK